LCKWTAGIRKDLKHTHNKNFFCTHLVKFLCTHLFFINLVFLSFLPSNSYADSRSILFISQEKKTLSSSLIESIKNKLLKESPGIDIKIQPDNEELSENIVETHDLIVTLGSKSTASILKLKFDKPVFSLLITERAFDSLNKLKNKNQTWTSLLLNHSIERQLLLIKHMLGENTTVGTIFGPYSSKYKNKVIEASKKVGLKLEHETAHITDQLISSLKNLTRRSDVLLAIPDPVTFNKKTIRGILLLTYRKNIPVIGFSKSYVIAGSAASIYSTPEQISNNATELLTDFLKNDLNFSKTKYQPKNFSISMNNKVIKTLGITAKDQNTLINLIKKDEENK